MFRIVKVSYSNNPCDFCFHKTDLTFDPGKAICSLDKSPTPRPWREDRCSSFFANPEHSESIRKRLREVFLKKEEPERQIVIHSCE
jgi:hypothetical protein